MKVYATRFEMVQDLAPGAVGAEIGVQRGDFAAEMLRTPIAKLHLVDCWKHLPGEYEKDPANVNDGGHEENYRYVLNRFLKEIAAQRVVVHRGMSQNMAHYFDASSLDFVYLDADHTFAGSVFDLQWWSSKVRSSGCIMGHDFVDNEAARKMGFGVVRAVEWWSAQAGWELIAITSEEWPSFKLMRK